MANDRITKRRLRRIEARRAQILDAAARLFAEKGFHAATTKEIAEAADIAEGTIYNYFETKEDLLIGIMSRLADSQAFRLVMQPDLIDQALSMSPTDFLTAMFRWRHSFVLQENNLAMLKAVTAEILVNQQFAERYYAQLIKPMIETWEKHLQARVERGETRRIIVPLIVRFLLAFNLGMLGFYVLGDSLIRSEWQSDVMIQSIVDLFMYGLANERDDALTGSSA